MNSKTHQSRDQIDWFKYWKDPLKTANPLITKKAFREKSSDQKNWKTHLSTDDVRIEKEFFSTVSKGTSGLSEDKDSIRERMLQKRSELSISDIERKSHGIYLNLISLDVFKKSNRIGLYSPIKGEVGTGSIFLHAVNSGKEVYFPEVSDSSLTFHRVCSLKELTVGKFGVSEPDPDAPLIDPLELDLLVIPGVAFDPSGSRIGYGKGYYDRAARVLPLVKRLGISYKFQLQKSIPTEDHDIAVGTLVHEQGIVFCSSKLGGD